MQSDLLGGLVAAFTCDDPVDVFIGNVANGKWLQDAEFFDRRCEFNDLLRINVLSRLVWIGFDSVQADIERTT